MIAAACKTLDVGLPLNRNIGPLRVVQVSTTVRIFIKRRCSDHNAETTEVKKEWASCGLLGCSYSWRFWPTC